MKPTEPIKLSSKISPRPQHKQSWSHLVSRKKTKKAARAVQMKPQAKHPHIVRNTDQNTLSLKK